MYEYHYDETDPRFNYEEMPKHAPSSAPKRLIRSAEVYQSEPEESFEGYSQHVLDILAHYSNAGIPQGCNGSGITGISKHGERFTEVHLLVNPETLMIEAAGFCARGDISTIVCASRAAELIEGKSVQEALALTQHRLRDDLGAMPPDRVTRTYLAVCAVHAAVADFFLRQGKTPEETRTVAPCDEDGMGCIMCEHCSYREKRIALRYA